MVKNNTGPIVTKEKLMVGYMIDIYCHKKHSTHKQLCSECEDLKQYALARLTFCCYGENKTTCEKCPTHCYRKDYKEKIKQVMRFSGPRMLWHHPILALLHLYKNSRSKQIALNNKRR